MMKGTAWDYALPAGRTLAGLIAALVLVFIGDVAGRVFNLLIGYPWPQEVHRHIVFVSIGMGAGVGAYLGWVNLSHRWYQMAAILLLVVAAGVLGVYVGRVYSPGVDPTYWWSRFATDSRLYLSAALAAIIVATAAGLIDQLITARRLKLRYQHTQASVDPWEPPDHGSKVLL